LEHEKKYEPDALTVTVIFFVIVARMKLISFLGPARVVQPESIMPSVLAVVYFCAIPPI
jgi:hypothetical protein